jgi:Domain of Unknown Function (DUF1206)
MPESAITQASSMARSKQLGWLAAAGFIARGIVYGLIGCLALGLALGIGGKTTSQQGALRTIGHQPLGTVMLVAIAAGLACYSFWRLTRAALGHGQVIEDGSLDRLVSLVIGIGYGGLCVTAISIVAGSSSSQSTTQTTGGVLGWTGGTLIVGIVGAIMIGVGIEQIHRGISSKFLEQLKTEQMDEHAKAVMSGLGTFGFVARGTVFALLGYFLIKAAVDFDPQAAVSIDGALSKLANASYGPLLLGLVAAGLVGFGAFSVAEARYAKT